jgi:uncharacterized membrane protein
VIACAVSSGGAVASLVTGLLVGRYAVEIGIAYGFVAAVTISMLGVVVIPVYVLKKLLVDYW